MFTHCGPRDFQAPHRSAWDTQTLGTLESLTTPDAHGSAEDDGYWRIDEQERSGRFEASRRRDVILVDDNFSTILLVVREAPRQAGHSHHSEHDFQRPTRCRSPFINIVMGGERSRTNLAFSPTFGADMTLDSDAAPRTRQASLSRYTSYPVDHDVSDPQAVAEEGRADHQPSHRLPRHRPDDADLVPVTLRAHIQRSSSMTCWLFARDAVFCAVRGPQVVRARAEPEEDVPALAEELV
ncbi:hypothetical protein V8E53_004259 [Lactarius tabidus]